MGAFNLLIVSVPQIIIAKYFVSCWPFKNNEGSLIATAS